MNTKRTFCILILVICLLGTLGCYQPKESDIVAEVGGYIITKQELAEHFMTKQNLEPIIMEKVVLLECRDRGILLDADQYKETMDGVIMQYGGKEVFEAELAKTGITLQEVSNTIKMQILITQVLEDQVGEPNDEEIEAVWIERKEALTREYAERFNTTPDKVVKEDVLDGIILYWKNIKQSEIQATYKEDLKAKWGVKNYYTGEGLEFTEVVKEAEEVAVMKDSGKTESEGEKEEHE